MKYNRKTVFIIFILIILIFLTNIINVKSNGESWTRRWTRRFDGGRGLVIDSNDDIYVVGDTDSDDGDRNICLLKYNKDGVLIWDLIWDLDGEDWGNSIALDSSENIYIAGTRNDNDAILLKCDKTGEVLWNRTWGGSKIDWCYGIAIDSSDNIYIAGYTESFGLASGNIFLVKYNNSGSLLWEFIWGTSDSEDFGDISIDSMNNIYIVGESNWNAILIKINSSGNELWNKFIDYWSDTQGVIIDSKNNVICAGQNLLRKYDNNGELLWTRILGDIFSLSDIAVDTNDNIYILEERTIKCPPDNLYFGGYLQCVCTAIYLENYNSSGEFLWEMRCTGCSACGGSGISIDSSNNIYICGILAIGTNQRNVQDILLMKNPKNWSGECTEIYLDLIAIGIIMLGIAIITISIVIIKVKKSKKLEIVRTDLHEDNTINNE